MARWPQSPGDNAIIIAITRCKMKQKNKWSLKPMAQSHVAHQVWWHVKAHNDLVDHQVAQWSTRWHEWSPDAMMEHQVGGRSTRWIFLRNRWLGGPPNGIVEQLCNGCAISGTITKLCHCSAQRDTTTRSPGDLMARMHGGTDYMAVTRCTKLLRHDHLLKCFFIRI